MKELLLQRGIKTIIDDVDYDLVKGFTWYASYNPHTHSYYAKSRVINDNKKVTSIFLSRYIMGVSEINDVIDHINHDTLDNRRSNLRVVTNRINSQNRLQQYKPRTSKYVGVSYDKINKKYRADITINNKRINLGRYTTEEEAASAYMNTVEGL